jgi:PAS domain S-box-containing protein
MMLAPPIPADELQRLAALHATRILDTPREERFDRITRISARLFHVPIALIVLVDKQRQWFKSCYGLDLNETPRHLSFCAHTILYDEILVIPDTQLDPRFIDHPLVIDAPFIRFYAGCPIHDISGYRLGTLCIIDRVPRQLNTEQQQTLRDMALWAEHEINATRISQAFIAQRASEARLQALMDSTGEAMLLISPDAVLLSANRVFCEFFALSKEKMLGRPAHYINAHLRQLFTNPQQVHELTIDTASDTQKHFTAFIQQKWPVTRELELFSTPVYTEQPERRHIGRLFVFRDITHERELDRMKSEFVSMVSHELRSPLTAIKGYIDLFVEGAIGPITPTQQHLLQIVQDNTDRLITMINDLLDLSRLEAGKLELRRVMTDPVALVQKTIELLRPQFDAKQQQLSFQQRGPIPQTLLDTSRIEQVLTNILSNARNYTPLGGKITVTVHSDEHYIIIDIEDTGIGMSREEQAHIFTSFYRGQSGLAEYKEGTGLGLTISRAIVEAHGGKITVASTPGQGSTFSILLPTIAKLHQHLTDKKL